MNKVVYFFFSIFIVVCSKKILKYISSSLGGFVVCLMVFSQDASVSSIRRIFQRGQFLRAFNGAGINMCVVWFDSDPIF